MGAIASLFFDRAELICTGSDAIFGKLQAEADAAGSSEADTSEGEDP
jgi:hypothetical protein